MSGDGSRRRHGGNCPPDQRPEEATEGERDQCPSTEHEDRRVEESRLPLALDTDDFEGMAVPAEQQTELFPSGGSLGPMALVAHS